MDARHHRHRLHAVFVAPLIALTFAVGGAEHSAASNPGFSISGPSSVAAGTPFTLTVAATTAGGQVDTAYTGTVHFDSITDASPFVRLPSDYTFAPADQGLHTFTKGFELATAGSTQTIGAVDTSSGSRTGTIAITVTAGPLSTLAFSTPAFVTAGTPFTGTVTARDSVGNTISGYGGTVAFSSSDAGATLPSSYAFQPGDNGTKSFQFTMVTPGHQTVRVADSAHSLTTTNDVTVSGPTTHLVVAISPPSGHTTVVTHVPAVAVVTAEDASGNQAPSYRGTVGFSSSDGTATLPAAYAFTAADAGSHTFSVTFDAVGSQSLHATDTVTPTITGTSSSNVQPDIASQLHVSVPASVSDGAPFTVTVTALDQYGNVATSYDGTIQFSTSDPSAFFATPTYTFQASDNGTKTFTNGVTLNTPGPQTVDATDSAASFHGVGNTTVTAGGAATHLAVVVPSAISGGQTFSIRVTALDATNATSTGYTGTVALSSSTDGTASFSPTTHTFLPGDEGTAVFMATLNVPGTSTITATDVANSLTKTSGSIAVAGPATKLVVTAPATATAGVPATVTATAEDSSNRMTTSYTGTVGLTSTDAQAIRPTNHAFTTGDCGVARPGGLDCGVHVFAINFATTGSWTVTATDQSVPTITGTSSNVAVSAGPATQLAFVSPPTAATAGSAFTLTLRAEDSFGNVASGGNGLSPYTGTVAFGSTDTGATLPSNYTFTGADLGQHTFSGGFTLTQMGHQQVTASDTGSSPVTGAVAALTVNPGATSQYALQGPQQAAAGTPFNLRAVTQDAYGNSTPAYRGRVTFTSSDVAASLPPNYTFTAGDQGVHVFSVTLNTPGPASSPKTVTATDTSSSSITGSEQFVVIGAASTLTLSPAWESASPGSAIGVTATLTDPFGNTAFGYTGTVHWTSSDPLASLPSNHTFTSDSTCGSGLTPTSDCGVSTFQMSLDTAGSQTVTATDTVNSSLSGSATVFINAPAPTVTGISPSSGPVTGGTQVVVTGTNFSGPGFTVTSVHMGSATITTTPCGSAPCFTVTSSSQLSLLTPPGSLGTVDIHVVTSGGVSATSDGDQFLYVPPPPTVTGVSPASGPAVGGTQVVVTGTNFSGPGWTVGSVAFGTAPLGACYTGTAAPCFTVDSPTQLTTGEWPGSGTVDITVATTGGTSATSPADRFSFQTDGIVMDGFGGLHQFGSGTPNLAGAAYWPGWDIARGLAEVPDGSGGYTLDAFGGVHPFGSAPSVGVTAYWPGWDIARGIALQPDGTSGYVLDGFGGVHPFGGAPNVAVTAYWPGWDIARGIVLRPDGVSGYVLDGEGGIHPFGGAPNVTATAYWPGWDIARAIVLEPGGDNGYVLDGFGGVHPINAAYPVTASAYWPGQDIARAIAVATAAYGGYVVDGFGGIHPFSAGYGSPPPVSGSAYWPGWDIARASASS